MATVPEYNRRVQPRPAAQVPFRNATSAETYGAGVGRALEGAGSGLIKLSQAMELRKALEEDTRRRESTEVFRRERREILLDPDDGFLNKEGLSASEDELRTVEERLEEARQRHADTLDGRAREDFLRDSAELVDKDLNDAFKHSAQESRNAAVAAHEASVNGWREEALSSWDDDTKFEAGLQHATEEQRKLAALRGVPKEVVEFAEEALISETLRQRAILIGKNKTATEAQVFIEANKERFTTEHLDELNTSLKPLIKQETARSIISKYETRKGGLDATTRRESGGNPKAVNRNESASVRAEGPSQFKPETWLSLIDQMKPEWAQGKTRQELLDLRTAEDGWYDAQVRKVWDDQNAAILKSHGFAKTNANMYALHHFGQAGGPAFLKAASTDPSVPAKEVWESVSGGASWAKVVAVNPWINEGWSAGELVRAIRETQGEGSYLGAGTVPLFDAAAAYAEAATIEDPELRAEVIKQIEAREALQIKMLNASSTATSKQVYEDYITTGNEDLSVEQALVLGPTGVEAFRSFVHNDKTGKDVTDVEGGTWGMLTEMASAQTREGMQKFSDLNLYQYASKLSTADLKQLLTRQGEVTSALEGEKLSAEQKLAAPVSISSEMRTDLKRVYGAFYDDKDKPEDRRRRYEMEKMLEQQIEEFRLKNKREPEGVEITDMLTAQMLDATAVNPGISRNFSGRLFETRSLPDSAQDVDIAVEYGSIPLDERRNIADLLTVIYGVTPTEDQVVTAYENKILAKGYLSSQGYSLEDVPPEAYTYATKEKGMSDDDVVLAWEAYMTGVLAGAINPAETPFYPEGSR